MTTTEIQEIPANTDVQNTIVIRGIHKVGPQERDDVSKKQKKRMQGLKIVSGGFSRVQKSAKKKVLVAITVGQ